VRTPYLGRYFYIRARTALGTESCELPGAGCAVRLHLLVERGGGESTRDLQIFRVAYHPGNTFLAGRLPGIHHIVERLAGIRQVVEEIFLLLLSYAYGEAGLVRINDWAWWEEKIRQKRRLRLGRVSAKGFTIRLRSGQAFSQRTREMVQPAPMR